MPWLDIASRVVITILITALALAILMGGAAAAEVWLALVIWLEGFTGSIAAGVVGVLLVSPLTWLLLYGLRGRS